MVMVIMVGDDGDDDCEVDTNARSPAPQGYSAGAEMRVQGLPWTNTNVIYGADDDDVGDDYDTMTMMSMRIVNQKRCNSALQIVVKS